MVPVCTGLLGEDGRVNSSVHTRLDSLDRNENVLRYKGRIRPGNQATDSKHNLKNSKERIIYVGFINYLIHFHISTDNIVERAYCNHHPPHYFHYHD